MLLATTVVIMSLGLGAVALLSPRGSYEVTDTSAGPVVSNIGVGSIPWNSGVRPGALGRWSEGADGPREMVVFHVGEADRGFLLAGAPPEDRDPLVIALACALLAAALLIARLPGVPALLAIATSAALLQFELQVGLPSALPVLAFAPLAALLTVRLGDRRRQLRFDLAGLLAIGVLLVIGLILAQGTIDVRWRDAWHLPTMVGLLIALAGGLIAFAIRYRALPMGTPNRLVAAAVPLASHSRLEGAEDERARLALELHNTVLPRVQTSLDALRHEGSVEAATSQLENIATDLRGSMARRQTVTLDIGGVAAALRSEFEDLPGPRVEFFVRGGSNRPPRRVELAAYRVGQAAIDNALRHSGAEKVNVTISSAPDVFELSVTDDGVGVDDLAEQEAQRRGRIGLAQMRLHAELVGATLELTSAPNQGTGVRFHWAV
jgi:signal transduction histidine kinase